MLEVNNRFPYFDVKKTLRKNEIFPIKTIFPAEGKSLNKILRPKPLIPKFLS